MEDLGGQADSLEAELRAGRAADLEDGSALRQPRLHDPAGAAYWREVLTPPGRRAWYSPKPSGWPWARFEEFARLFERAFESRSPEAKSGAGADPWGVRSGWDDPKLARAIELAWSRLSLYRERAEEERGRVEALLEQAMGAGAAGRGRAQCLRELATAMVDFLGGYGEALQRALKLERALVEALEAYRRRQREREARQEEQEEGDEDDSPSESTTEAPARPSKEKVVAPGPSADPWPRSGQARRLFPSGGAAA